MIRQTLRIWLTSWIVYGWFTVARGGRKQRDWHVGPVCAGCSGVCRSLCVTFDQMPTVCWTWRIWRVMDVWYFRWMSLCNIIELWRSPVHTHPPLLQHTEWCIDRLIYNTSDSTLHLTSWPLMKITTSNRLWIYTPLTSGGTDGCHVTSFAYRLNHYKWSPSPFSDFPIRLVCTLIVQLCC